MATPRPRTSPGTGSALGPRRTGAAGGAGEAVDVALVGGSALPLRLEDLRDDSALRVEELVVDRVPAAELVDLEELGRGREFVGGGRALHDRPIALAGEDLLGLLRVEEVDERLGLLGLLGLVDHGYRVLDEDRLVRDHVIHLLALLLREDRLVLVAEQDVAFPARERLQRLPGALVEHWHVLEELRKVVLRLL